MNYLFDEYGRFAGISETATDRSTTVEPAELTSDYNWNDYEWVYALNVSTITATITVSEKSPEQLKQDVENSLIKFAKERDFDGIGEASALLNSTNLEWQQDAATFVRFWDETWQAFYSNNELPVLSWD